LPGGLIRKFELHLFTWRRHWANDQKISDLEAVDLLVLGAALAQIDKHDLGSCGTVLGS
jgi:hypothetical protein